MSEQEEIEERNTYYSNLRRKEHKRIVVSLILGLIISYLYTQLIK